MNDYHAAEQRLSASQAVHLPQAEPGEIANAITEGLLEIANAIRSLNLQREG
jgi:hypothetical protein